MRAVGVNSRNLMLGYIFKILFGKSKRNQEQFVSREEDTVFEEELIVGKFFLRRGLLDRSKEIIKESSGHDVSDDLMKEVLRKNPVILGSIVGYDVIDKIDEYRLLEAYFDHKYLSKRCPEGLKWAGASPHSPPLASPAPPRPPTQS